MPKQIKDWGWTEVVIDTPLMSAHRYHMDKGGYSSIHHHQRKWNAFCVVSGFLRIVRVGKADIDLGPGDVLAVPPDVNHRMMAITDVEAIEWYWPDILAEDIVRLDLGGKHVRN